MLGSGVRVCLIGLMVVLDGLALARPVQAQPQTQPQAGPKVEVVPSVGHTGAINALAISADGQLALSASEDATIKVWQLQSGRLLRTLRQPPPAVAEPPPDRRGGGDAEDANQNEERRGVSAVTFSGDGAFAIAGTRDGRLHAWDVASGRLTGSVAVSESSVGAVAAAGKSGIVVSIDSGMLRFWKQDGLSPASGPVEAKGLDKIAVSPDGRQLVAYGSSAANPPVAQLYALPSGQFVRALPSIKGPESVAFQKDNQTLIVATSNYNYDQGGRSALRRVNLATEAVSLDLEMPRGMHGDALSADGLVLVRGYPETSPGQPAAIPIVEVWDITAPQIRKIGLRAASDASQAVFSPSSRGLLTWGSGHDTDAGRTVSPFEYWNPRTGDLIRSLAGPGTIKTLAFSDDGQRLLSRMNGAHPLVWSPWEGRLLHALKGKGKAPAATQFAHGGQQVVTHAEDVAYTVWDAQQGKSLPMALQPKEMNVTSGQRDVEDEPDEKLAFMATLTAAGTVNVWNAATGKLARAIARPPRPAGQPDDGYDNNPVVSVSKDGRWIAVREKDEIVLYETAKTQPVRRIKPPANGQIKGAAFSPDGKQIAYAVSSVAREWTVHVRETASNKAVGSFKTEVKLSSLQFSPAGRYLVVHGFKHVSVYTTQNWKQATSGGWSSGAPLYFDFFDSDKRTLVRKYAKSRGIYFYLANDPGDQSTVFWKARVRGDGAFASHAGSKRLAVGDGRMITLWNSADGAAAGTLPGHAGRITSLAFHPDGEWLASGGDDGQIHLWNLNAMTLAATFTGRADGEWIAQTPAGFFAASSKGTDEMVSVVRGLETWSIWQFYDHLGQSDLLRDNLKGDPLGRHKDEASRINLEKILDTGPAPQIEPMPERTERAGSTIKMSVRLTDLGGGIGDKVEWRVNGVTQGTLGAAPGGAPAADGPRIVEQVLRIDPRKQNIITVTGYSRAREGAARSARAVDPTKAEITLASEPLKIVVDSSGETTEMRPRMHVLAIGVSNYAHTEFKLNHASHDATSFAKALQTVARDLYGEVVPVTVVDADATRASIEAAVDQLARVAQPQDVFILYIAGHGRSIAGTYYFLPQDFTPSASSTVETRGIGLPMWQSWLARIPAQKSVLVFDTCESATATALTRDLGQRENAMDRIREATGRSVITAARQAAFEGYKGHGILTYTLLEAMQRPEGQRESEVDLLGLAAHVEASVSDLTFKVFQSRQRPHSKIEGNFPIGVRKASIMLGVGAAEPISRIPSHVVLREERLREEPAEEAPGSRKLPPGTLVHVVKFAGTFAVVAIEGQQVGYIPQAALLKIAQ